MSPMTTTKALRRNQKDVKDHFSPLSPTWVSSPFELEKTRRQDASVRIIQDHTGINFPEKHFGLRICRLWWPSKEQLLLQGEVRRNWNGLLATWRGCTFASWRRCVRVADSKRVLQPYNVNVLREKGVMLDKIFWVTYATEFCFASVHLYIRFWYCYRGARGVDLQVAFFVHQFFNYLNGEIARDSVW